MCHAKNKYNIHVLLPLLIGLGFSILYAFFPTKMLLTDGLGCAYDMENFPAFYTVHQHHPLWLPIMHITFHFFKIVIPGIRSISYLYLLSALFGGVVVTLFITLAKKITNNNFASIISGLFLGVSWGIMSNSTDATVYMLMMTLMLIIGIYISSKDELSLKHAVIATLLILGASLIHQIIFFFTFSILVWIILNSKRNKALLSSLICISIYVFGGILSYYLFYIYSISYVGDEIKISFFRWLTAYAYNPGWWTYEVFGFQRAQDIFYFSQVNLFLHIPQSELIHHARSYDSIVTNSFFIIFHIIITTSILWEIICLIQKRDKDIKTRKTRIVLLAWLLPFFIFNQFYCAVEMHFKLFYLLPLLVLWTMRIIHVPHKFKTFTAISACILVAFLAIWNFQTGLLPNSKLETNPFLKSVHAIKPVVHGKDLLIFSDHQNYISFLAIYYTDATAVTMRRKFSKFAVIDESTDEIEKQTIDFINKHFERILVSDQAFSDMPDPVVFSAHFFPLPHPWLLSISKSSIKKIGEVKTEDGEILHEVKFISSADLLI